MKNQNFVLTESWENALSVEFKKPYYGHLLAFIEREYNEVIVYPPAPLVFNAFLQTPLEKVKVVILGQDPYHGPNQAHGLSFSVPAGVPVPRSLKNIFKELHADVSVPVPEHGNLEAWAQQGVLMLNTVLTVRAKEPQSHRGKGWEQFTDKVIEVLSEQKKNIVFFLWGNDAKTKKNLIDSTKHLVLLAAHPSPYSASNGFFGCRHFSKANAYLKGLGLKEIDWEIR